MVCNVPVSYKANGDRNQWGAWIENDLIFVDHLCCLCLVFAMLSHLIIAALWSPAGKGLTSWFLFVMFNCDFVTFPCGILGQV